MSTPPSNPNWQQIQQIQQQNQVAQQALASGKISQAQYNAFMAEQNRQLAQLQKNYSPVPRPYPQPSPTPTLGTAPTPVPTPAPTPAPVPSPVTVTDKPQPLPDPSPNITSTPSTTETLETPKQVGVVFTTGSITQAEIDAYAARGVILVPDSLKLPVGARVTGSKIEDGQILVSFQTKEQIDMLAADAPKWATAGFSELSGVALFPELPAGATLVSAELKEGQLLYSYQPPIDPQTVEVNRLLSIRQAFAPVSAYYQAVSAKTAEFNALPLETKISEIKRLMPDALVETQDRIITDVTYTGNALNFSSIIDPKAVTAKEQEFMSLSPSQRVAEVQRLMPDAFMTAGVDVSKVVDVQLEKGQLVFVSESPTPVKQEAEFLGPVQGFKVPEGYEFKGVETEKLNVLSPSEKKLAQNWLGGAANTFSQPTGKEATVSKVVLEPKGEYYGDTFVPEKMLDVRLPTLGGYTPRMLIAMEKSPEMQDVVIPTFELLAVSGMVVAAPVVAPAIGLGGILTAKGVLLSAGLNVGIYSAVNYATTGQTPTIRQMSDLAVIGAVTEFGAASVIKIGNVFYRASGLASSRLVIGMKSDIQPVFASPVKSLRGSVDNINVVKMMRQSHLAYKMETEVRPAIEVYTDPVVSRVKNVFSSHRLPTQAERNIESTFGKWSTHATKGTPEYVMEAEYGSAFYTAETLSRATPTKDWLRYTTITRTQAEKEAVLSWGWDAEIGGVVQTSREAFLASQNLFEATPTTRQSDESLYFYKNVYQSQAREIESVFGWEEPVMSMKGGQVVVASVASRDAFAAAESLKMSSPTRQPEQTWYVKTTGSPSTPFEITLRNALYGSKLPDQGMGGIAAIQQLVYRRPTIIPPSPANFYQAPVRFAGVNLAEAYVPQRLFFGKQEPNTATYFDDAYQTAPAAVMRINEKNVFIMFPIMTSIGQQNTLDQTQFMYTPAIITPIQQLNYALSNRLQLWQTSHQQIGQFPIQDSWQSQISLAAQTPINIQSELVTQQLTQQTMQIQQTNFAQIQLQQQLIKLYAVQHATTTKQNKMDISSNISRLPFRFTSQIAIPQSINEKQFFRASKKKGRRGKYKKGVWEFDIMEGPQVMKELF
jgi:hypothetical protein